MLGDFETQPLLTNGCTSVEVCVILTPYNAFGFVISVVELINETGEFDQFSNTATLADRDQSLFLGTFAMWSLASVPVAEPSTLALIGLGLLGLGVVRRRAA